MRSKRRIVVAYDGSESSRLALTWGLGAGRAHGLEVLVVHAVDEAARVGDGLAAGGYTGSARQMIHDSVDELLVEAADTARLEFPTVSLETHVVYGAAVPGLLDLIADAEMCVVGSRGRGGFAGLLLGSTSVELTAHATCPIVVVRSQQSAEPGSESGRVVVGVDGSDAGAAAVAFAFEEASLRGVALTAIHAWELPFVEVPLLGGPDRVESLYGENESSEGRLLAEALSGWQERFPDVSVRRKLLRGTAAQILIEASPGAELLVVGSRGRGGFSTLLLGSVSHAVLHHARSPVAVVRGDHASGLHQDE